MKKSLLYIINAEKKKPMGLRSTIYIIFVSFLLLFRQELPAQEKTDYPELELYRQTLSPEQTETYRIALEAYNKDLKTTPAKKSKKVSEIRQISQKFTQYFRGNPINYASAFILALELEEALDNTTEEEYPDKRADYFRLGEAYYLFNDFEKSITILKKVVTDNPPRSFTDCANLDARKIIGICYANMNKMDTSDYYFRSILESPDMVLDRPVYNAYALSYLGCNAMIRGEYEKALVLDDVILPFFRSYTDYGHLAGMYYCRASSYFATDNIRQSGLAADSVLIYANRDTYHPYKRRKQAFTALIHYNVAIDNTTRIKAYSDSLINIYRQEANEHTSQYITNAWQQKYEQDTARAEQESATYRRSMIIGFIIAAIFILLSGYTFIQYRHLRTAYRVLAEKSHRWAEHISEDYCLDVKKLSKTSTPEEVHIMQQVHDYVITAKNYLNPELSLDRLAQDLATNRSYLSSAVNNVMGKNFNAYINEYRISEAIRILNSRNNNRYPIDDIYLACGFNSKRSFYYSFKKITGITPGKYLENHPLKG